ncbi:MAG TPA: hypothetical protein VNK05_14920, partial [Chloroflexota bacterium]|nr:hypothetical protein [Chloroflexota bacterium]
MLTAFFAPGGAVPLAAAVAVLVTTVVCVLLRPGGVGEAWSAAGGAAVALLLGLARPADVVAAVQDLWPVLLFLVTVMALAGLAERAMAASDTDALPDDAVAALTAGLDVDAA